MKRRYKPLFEKQELVRGDSVQDKHKKVAKMMFNDEINKLQDGIIYSENFSDCMNAFLKFKTRIRKIVKKL